MGDFDHGSPGSCESSLKYHPLLLVRLTLSLESGEGTVSEGQFDWGGFLPKCNGGARRYTQHGRSSCVERKGISVPYCKTDGSSSYESRT